MSLVLFEKQTLWTGTDVSIGTPSNGGQHWWLNDNTCVADAVNIPALAWFRIPTNGADRLFIQWGGKVASLNNVTAVTNSSLRATALGMPFVDPNAVGFVQPPIVAGGVATRIVLARAGQGLNMTIISGGASDAQSPAQANTNPGVSTFDSTLFGSGGRPLNMTAMLHALVTTGETPVVDDPTGWFLEISRPVYLTTINPASSNPALGNAGIGGIAVVWLALKAVNALTVGASPALGITGSLVALKYKDVATVDPRDDKHSHLPGKAFGV